MCLTISAERGEPIKLRDSKVARLIPGSAEADHSLRISVLGTVSRIQYSNSLASC
jgi:hypothetical protein